MSHHGEHHQGQDCDCDCDCEGKCKEGDCDCDEGCCGCGECSGGSCHCGGECSCKGGHFQRRYQTKDEQIVELEAYLSELKLEVQAVEERLADLRK
jgi:hypothetical protein